MSGHCPRGPWLQPQQKRAGSCGRTSTTKKVRPPVNPIEAGIAILVVTKQSIKMPIVSMKAVISVSEMVQHHHPHECRELRHLRATPFSLFFLFLFPKATSFKAHQNSREGRSRHSAEIVLSGVYSIWVDWGALRFVVSDRHHVPVANNFAGGRPS